MMPTNAAIVAGGCFWGLQELFRYHPGVIDTEVGYCGGTLDKPTYNDLKNTTTGHAEALRIIYDPAQLTYRQLLEFFFQIHDPTTLNRQGNDHGPSYRSVIFFANERERKISEAVIAEINASGKWPGDVVTQLIPTLPFYRAEPEHQDYLQRYPQGYTCHWIRPNWTLT